MHVRIEKRKTARRKSSHLALIKLIAHADFEDTGQHGDVFAFGMPMRRDAIPVRHPQPHRVISAGGARVALEYRDLRAGSHERRSGPVRDGVRREYMFFRRSSLSVTAKDHS